MYRTKRRFVLGDLKAALSEEPRPGAERKLSGKEEALLVATACSKPPAGRARWTLELLADEMVRLTEHRSLSRETIRRRLAENDLKPWRRRCGASRRSTPNSSPGWRTCSTSTPRRPIEPPGGLLRREPDPAHRRGARAGPRQAGSARALRLRVRAQRHRQSLHVPRRRIGPGARSKVTDQPNAQSTSPPACATSRTCTTPRPSASASSSTICRPTRRRALPAFPADEARRVLRRLEFHYVPKHASWLNMVEIEIGVLAAQCLDRRIDSIEQLTAETAAWEQQRNAAGARIKWMFTTEKARAKMGHAYPRPRLTQVTLKESKPLCSGTRRRIHETTQLHLGLSIKRNAAFSGIPYDFELWKRSTSIVLDPGGLMTETLLPTSLVGSYAQPNWLIDRKRLAERFPPRVRARELWRDGISRRGAGRRHAARHSRPGARRPGHHHRRRAAR